jgi:uncharacterized protein (TIGR04255 family)
MSGLMSIARTTPGDEPRDYERPPVVEVALATSFQPIQGLNVIGLADVWRRLFAEDLPYVEQHPPVQMPAEQLDSPVPQPTISLQMSAAPPLPRLWFKNEAGTKLAQLQTDWFARNWRKVGSAEAYPRYPAIRAAFERDLTAIAEHVERNGLGNMSPVQCEITYINHIERSDGADTLPSDALVIANESPDSMPTPEAARLDQQYLLAHGDANIGRLHISANTAVRRHDERHILVLTMTARGRPLGDGVAGVLEFLDLGRARIYEAFNALTRPEMQIQWGGHRE